MIVFKKSAVFMDEDDGMITIDSKHGIEFLDAESVEIASSSIGPVATDVERCIQVLVCGVDEKFEVITPVTKGAGYVLYRGNGYSILITPDCKIRLTPTDCLDVKLIERVQELENKLAECTADIVGQCLDYKVSDLPALY